MYPPRPAAGKGPNYKDHSSSDLDDDEVKEEVEEEQQEEEVEEEDLIPKRRSSCDVLSNDTLTWKQIALT